MDAYEKKNNPNRKYAWGIRKGGTQKAYKYMKKYLK